MACPIHRLLLALACSLGLLAVVPPAQANQVSKITPDASRTVVASPARFTLTFDVPVREVNCGLRVDWGDGTVQRLRVGEDLDVPAPFVLSHTYATAGKRRVRLTGDMIFRGLRTVPACLVDVSAELDVLEAADAARAGVSPADKPATVAAAPTTAPAPPSASATAPGAGNPPAAAVAAPSSSLPACPSSGLRNNGWGQVTLEGGIQYVGDFRDGRPSGQGSYSFPDGSRYSGEVKDGRPNGQGTFSSPKGERYVGEFRNDKFNGQGTLVFASGNKYVGEFRDGKANGQGSLVLSTGDKYVGEFRDNVFNGQGTMNFASGGRLVGQFRDGKADGEAVEYRADGSVLRSGLWTAGQLVQARTPEPAPAVAANAPVAAAPASTAAATPPPAPMRVMANRKALVVGNDAYTQVARLDNAGADAKAMAEALRNVGFQVTLELNLSERNFKEVLRSFRMRVQGGDEVVIFFAGHGVQIGSSNYLLPTDMRGTNEEQVKDDAIELQKILYDMHERRPRFFLAIVDACRDNPFKVAGRGFGTRGLAPVFAASGQMVIFSAGAGQQALDRLGKDDKDPNGLFTRLFVREMTKPGLPVDRIVRNVRTEVLRLAKTVGHEQSPALYDESQGDYYFRP